MLLTCGCLEMFHIALLGFGKHWSCMPYLQEMGNVLVAAAKDVYLGAMALGNQVGQYFRFQYVLLNGPNSIFTG